MHTRKLHHFFSLLFPSFHFNYENSERTGETLTKEEIVQLANESDELNEFDSNDTNNLGPKKVVLENALTGLSEIES